MPTVSDWGCSPEALKAFRLIRRIGYIGLIAAILYWAALWLKIRNSSPSFKAPATPAGATFEDLLDAICWVESDCEAGMMGDAEPIILERKVGATAEINYRAIGAYQLHKIYVDDVNRILRIWRDSLSETFRKYYASRPYDPNGIESVDFEPYTYEDRWNKKHSRFMTEVYLRYYAPLNDNLEINLEAAARIHNGGPDGWKKKSTKPYWEKVKARMTAKFMTNTGEPK